MPVRALEPNDLRVLLCFTFDHRATPDDVASFKEKLITSETVLHSVEVAGSFDFICEERFPNLRSYHRRHADLASDIARLTERFEACFVCKRFIREETPQLDALWVSCHDGKRRIPVEQIQAIHAEGDYVRLDVGREELLHDATMNALEATLNSSEFARLHRSMIVRLDRIACLIHQDHGWAVRLVDGTEQRIAKSRLARVMKVIRESSAMEEVGSSTNETDRRLHEYAEREVVERKQSEEEKTPSG
ncbi:LytTR family transcriptional regulator [Sphingomonas sp. HDW15A]|uniref:LytR/AlgR family response regulator transcription factor n=1 Tax=Sphingomonas sp. HDW15A TaxID=2714942 RepID=UPI001409BA16|nr:LytTR family DNA-binding domain-containing protein [Sphingomonas sp. HDW15A]QIK95851.1 LytTR family transcriptional regulator [Sphingomonas sp. HDW15A]